MLFEKTSTVEQTMRKLVARVTRDEECRSNRQFYF